MAMPPKKTASESQPGARRSGRSPRSEEELREAVKTRLAEGVESPLLPLKDVVVFPHQVVPLFVGRPRSIAAVEEASRSRTRLVLVTQKNPLQEDPLPSDVHAVGTTAEIIQVLRLPDGLRLIIEGKERVSLEGVRDASETLRAVARPLSEDPRPPQSPDEEAAVRSLLDLFEEHVRLHPKLPMEVLQATAGIESLGRLADAVAAQLTLRPQIKQQLLETVDPRQRVEAVIKALSAENQVLALERQINSRVRKRMERHQREAWLQEQLRAIQQELGQKPDEVSEAAELRKKLEAKKLPKEAREKAFKELQRFERMAPLSAEASVIRTYLDWILALPWGKFTKDNPDLKRAERILDEEHEGLAKPKARVLDFLAVRQLGGGLKGPILCLVGPPGVGKTSLARSVARSLGRKFERVSLGGVRDEAEIRGHRRTYIGALPGRLVQALKRAGSSNPVILLDEVDKMAADFRGDPAAALLEVLDPEQNHAFNDHYLDLQLDLSRVLFLCTANDLYAIPGPLRDRLEVIELPGYLEEEKLGIAKRFLLKRQLEAHGLKPGQVQLSDEVLLRLIRDYTREAGVRELERQIGALCRKAARAVVESKNKDHIFHVDQADLLKHLGVPRYAKESLQEKPRVGVALGLAWTPVGGDILAIEVSLARGKGGLLITGQLGEVMKESAQAALSWLRAHAKELGLKPDFAAKTDIHIHVPEGATPKDGPSAGITMATALASAFTGRPVRQGVAMTGELTLRGRVLPIGGLKEKSLAARREGLGTLIIPRGNRKDLAEVPEEARRAIQWHLVSDVSQVLKLALEPKKASLSQRRAAERAVPAAELWHEGMTKN
jgi:ATP-dependent Lon protease